MREAEAGRGNVNSQRIQPSKIAINPNYIFFDF